MPSEGRPRDAEQAGGAPLVSAGLIVDKFYVAGDGRVNENIGLTTVHSIFHAEHNRLAHDIDKDPALLYAVLHNMQAQKGRVLGVFMPVRI